MGVYLNRLYSNRIESDNLEECNDILIVTHFNLKLCKFRLNRFLIQFYRHKMSREICIILIANVYGFSEQNDPWLEYVFSHCKQHLKMVTVNSIKCQSKLENYFYQGTKTKANDNLTMYSLMRISIESFCHYSVERIHLLPFYSEIYDQFSNLMSSTLFQFPIFI